MRINIIVILIILELGIFKICVFEFSKSVERSSRLDEANFDHESIRWIYGISLFYPYIGVRY